MNRVKIAIVGSGPGGLSAAAHAAEVGISHLLLESAPHLADTIQRYQKGKPVMDEPRILPLRCPLDFTASSREQVLDVWAQGLARYNVDIRYNAEVTGISGQQGDFTLRIKDQEPVAAEHVVLAIGIEGNPRMMEVPGENLPIVQYQLADPEAYQDETIVVVGAGDSAIENAVALAKYHNRVVIVNRRDEFARAKQGNLDLILSHIESGKIQCFYNTKVKEITESSEDKAYAIALSTENGEEKIPCDRIIARLGANPPRKFVEACGIAFPNAAADALPNLDTKYQSSVPGLYVIGSLGGYPLIKQALNQGYEVVEHILGRAVQPADHALMEDRLKPLPFDLDVDETLQLLRDRIPLFAEINPLLFREFMLYSRIVSYAAGDVIYRTNAFADSFYIILRGQVNVDLEGDPSKRHTLGARQVFGEQSLISGRRRNETVSAADACIVVETPRRTMVKLINTNDAIRQGVDWLSIGHAIQARFTPALPLAALEATINAAKLETFKTDEFVYQEGDRGDSLYLVRMGSLTVSRKIGGRDIVLAYVPAGGYVGELGLLGNPRRMDTVRATVQTEAIRIERSTFLELLQKDARLKDAVQEQLRRRKDEETRLAARPEGGDILTFFMQHGLGEATDVLLIDEALCIGCDNCEKACAETHGGVSRLDRATGPSFATVHVPIACRHCEQPHCMKECPPDAIHRNEDGAVYIDDTCIGCTACEQNCPYNAIHMAPAPLHKPNLMRWLLTGFGQAPGEDLTKRNISSPTETKKAVKCDLCMGVSGGPACVRACPTGAAMRVGPDEYLDLVTRVAESNL